MLKSKLIVLAVMVVTITTGCAVADWIREDAEAVKNVLVLRVSYRIPAQQAGVLEIAQEQANRLDEAIQSGDIERVRVVLKSMEPIYREIYANVRLPTPEQVAFHERVSELWEYLDQDDEDRWRALAVSLLADVFTTVVL